MCADSGDMSCPGCGSDIQGGDKYCRVCGRDVAPSIVKKPLPDGKAPIVMTVVIVLALAAAVGCIMLFYGPWWLVIVGVLIMISALAYSAGPYPLSHHGLGDLAVIIFFGIIPVTLTCFLQTGSWKGLNIIIPASLAVGLLAANVLIVNNYRDMEDDAAVGKRTTVVIFGRKFMSLAYLLSGVAGMVVMFPVWMELPLWSLAVPAVYIVLHIKVWLKLRQATGTALNPLLGRTAVNLLLFSLLFISASLFV